MMNKNGQVIFFTFMIGLTVMVLALALAFPVKEAVENTTNSTGNAQGSSTTLNCNNDSISSFDKGACIVSDLSMFYYIGGLIMLVGTILAARVLL